MHRKASSKDGVMVFRRYHVVMIDLLAPLIEDMQEVK